MSKNKKHDGVLPPRNELSSEGEVWWSGSFVWIRCGMNVVLLDRQQAHALFAWLEQELVEERDA